MSTDLQLFDYTFINNNAEKTLFLFHGTGGSKEDFLFLDELLLQKYNLVGLQGNVLEQGMARFFKRISHGVFDQENIKLETYKLQKFLKVWSAKYSVSAKQMSFLGYSNGANMLLCMLFYYPELIHKVVLLHPMIPIKKKYPDLVDSSIFVSFGKNDPFLSNDEQQVLIQTLQHTKATLFIKEYEGGHEISNQEMQDVLSFLSN